MSVLANVRLTIRLVILVILVAILVVGLIGLVGLPVAALEERMLEDRISTLLRDVTEAEGFAAQLQEQVIEGRMRPGEVMARFREQIHRVRFGGPDHYLLAQTEKGLVCAQPVR